MLEKALDKMVNFTNDEKTEFILGVVNEYKNQLRQ